MSLAVVLAYGLVFALTDRSATTTPPLAWALRLWLVQLGVAAPLLLTTVDYGRWYAMMFCAGLGFLLLGRQGAGNRLLVEPLGPSSARFR